MKLASLPFFLCAFSSAQAQTFESSEGSLRFNIDILPISDTCLNPGDTFSFEVVTRLAAGGNTAFGLGNIDYSIDLGLTVITFEGVQADGSFATAIASSNGSVVGSMLDIVDADNDFVPSSSSSEFGILRADDGLDRVDPNDSGWDSDWVFQIDWTVPLDATLGSYAVTAEETVDFFVPPDRFEDQATATFPGAHTPFSIKVVPEPSAAFLCLAASLGLLRRRRDVRG